MSRQDQAKETLKQLAEKHAAFWAVDETAFVLGFMHGYSTAQDEQIRAYGRIAERDGQ